MGLPRVPLPRPVAGYDPHELVSLFDDLGEIDREAESVMQRLHEFRPSLYDFVQLPPVDSINAL